MHHIEGEVARSPTTITLLGHSQSNEYVNSGEYDGVASEYERGRAPFDERCIERRVRHDHGQSVC